MAPELKTPDLDDDLRSAFRLQSPYELDHELEEDTTTEDDTLDRQIFAGLVTP